MNTHLHRVICLIVGALVAFGCGDGVDPVEGPAETQTLTFEDDKADSNGELRVRADGMTIWAQPQVEFVVGEEIWRLRARSSYTLDAVSAEIGGEQLDAFTVSARKFEVKLSASQMYENLREEPLVVTLETASGKTFHAMFVSRARFRNTSGSSLIYPWVNIEPILIGDRAHFRARATTRRTMENLWGSNDDDSEPLTRADGPKHWVLDFVAQSIIWAASPTEDALIIVASDDQGRSYQRRSPIHMEIVEMGITSGNPVEAWPSASCEADVQACVEALPVSLETDYSSCGSLRQVEPCLPDFGAERMTNTIKSRFMRGLFFSIRDTYQSQGADIEAAGGATQSEAILALGTGQMTEITDPEDDPLGHDLSQVRVFSHPDTIFVGSDIVWIGAFDRETGAEISVERFN